MIKNYCNDLRPLPKPQIMECCDCRNVFKISFIERYPHGPDSLQYCPVCGAKGNIPDASFRKVTND